MPKFSLRRYDIQAVVSTIVSFVSLGALLVLGGLLARNINWADKVIVYGNRKYELLIQLLAAVTGLLALTGFGFGANSAGQRRNEKAGLSWVGFFIGAGVLCLTVIIVFLFRARKEFVG